MDAGAATVLEIFEKKHRLEVPLFQRQYVWNKEHQWDPLWEDISRKFADYIRGRRDGPVHFLGAMVLDQKQTPTTRIEKRQVIDGQQRLTTLQIFLAALRDFCREHHCDETAEEFDELTRNTLRSSDHPDEAFKVWPTQRDRDQFADVMNAGSRAKLEEKHPLIRKPRRKKFEPRPRMVEAYVFFSRQIAEFFLGSANEPPLESERPLAERLEDALSALRGAFKVVVIDLGEGDDAQVIFETLNARGEPLLPADLLRNFIFLRAARQGESSDDLYGTYWKPFDEPLWRDQVRQGRLIRSRSDIFLQHYLSSRRFDEIPISHLFVEYKHWLATAKPFKNVAEELEVLAKARENYRKLIVSPTNTPLGSFNRFLDVFDVGTASPLLLVVLEAHSSETELNEMLRMLESYILRRAVCQLPTKAYNRVFLSIASYLKANGVNPGSLRFRLSSLAGESSLWPTDVKFSEAVANSAGYRTLSHGRIVYILKAINQAMHTARSEEITVHSELTVEHIMPQQWISHWPLQDGSKGLTWADRVADDSPESLPRKQASSVRDSAIQRLGNLTLLTQPLNSSVSNSAWSVKRTELSRHGALALNRALVDVTNWDEAAIEKRGKDLLAIASKLWPGPQEQSSPQSGTR